MLPLVIRPPTAFDPRALTEVHAWRDVSGVVCARGYVGNGQQWICWPGFAAFRFDACGIEAFPARAIDPAHVTDLCRRSVEPLALQALGWEVLHASAVSTPAGLVAFCGECESGKSTLAYTLSRRGYRQFADDSLVMQVDEAGVRGLNLPFGIRLRKEAARFFGVVSDRERSSEVAPLVVQPHDEIATEPLSAILVVHRVEGTNPSVTRLSAGSAFVALLPHSRSFNPNDPVRRRRLLEAYLQVAATVAVYELRFSAGLDRIESLLDLVEQTGCGEPASNAV